MSKIIDINTRNEVHQDSCTIDIAAIMQSSRRLRAGLIAPATEIVETEIAPEHAAEPIKRIEDIDRICASTSVFE